MEQMIALGLAIKERENNQSDRDLYSDHWECMKVKSIDASNYEETGQISITTTKTHYNTALLGDSWIEVYFTIEYDLDAEKEIEEYMMKEWYKFDEVSKAVFYQIKTLGRKMWKFFSDDHMMNVKAHKRKMNITEYDDVNKIHHIYWKKVRDYDELVEDLKHLKWRVHEDKGAKREYESDKEKYDSYKELSKKLLEEMSSGSSSETDIE